MLYAKRSLERARGVAKGYQSLLATIVDHYQQKQLHASSEEEAYEYEKIKDLWSELWIRTQKEVFYIEKIVMKRFNNYVDEPCRIYEVKSKIVPNFNDEDYMMKLYKRIYNRTNRRIFRLEKITKYLLKRKKDMELLADLERVIELFDKTVRPCVLSNFVNLNKYHGRFESTDLKPEDLNYSILSKIEEK